MDKNELHTISVTLKLPNGLRNNLENYLNTNFILIDFRVMPNTEKMYKEDSYFQKLVKQKKDLSNSILDYINRNNYKYHD